ncbi:hypothetical protein ABIE18_003886 [Arthrobacter sp. 2762]
MWFLVPDAVELVVGGQHLFMLSGHAHNMMSALKAWSVFGKFRLRRGCGLVPTRAGQRGAMFCGGVLLTDCSWFKGNDPSSGARWLHDLWLVSAEEAFDTVSSTDSLKGQRSVCIHATSLLWRDLKQHNTIVFRADFLFGGVVPSPMHQHGRCRGVNQRCLDRLKVIETPVWSRSRPIAGCRKAP